MHETDYWSIGSKQADFSLTGPHGRCILDSLWLVPALESADCVLRVVEDTSISKNSEMYRVNFITTEQKDDLIVSFAIAAGDLPGDILSLTLLRTPKYEFILDPEERGVSVSWEEDEDETELLLKVERSKEVVKLHTTRRQFVLDVSHVDDDDFKRMAKVLHKMNFDKAIRLTGV